MTTAAMKRISQLGQYRFLDAFNSAIFQKTAAQKVIYVDSNTGTDSATRSGEDIRSPLATIDYAVNKCTAGNLDTVLVLPMHAETVTSAITLDTAGVSVCGLKHGNRRPVITPNGAINAVTITADNCEFGGFRFGTPGTDVQTSDFNVAGANFRAFDNTHLGATTGTLNKVNVYVLNTGGDNCLMEDIRIYNAAVEVPAAIKIAAAVDKLEIRRTVVLDVIGFTNGAIYDAAAATHLWIHECTFQNAKAATAVVNFVANSAGVMEYCNVSGRNTTIANNVVTGTSMDFFCVYTCEEPCKNGMLIPVIDAE